MGKMKVTHTKHLEKIINNLPKNPWVYQMKDIHGKVIYVWKAKNLSQRVRSYFDLGTDLSPAKKHMLEHITDIELIICETEVEALVLETNLIKHFSPKYNILMKDDKNLSYIKITNSPVPELIKTRKKIEDGSQYFWPYVSWVEQSVHAIRRAFRIRKCRIRFGYSIDNMIQITDKASMTLPCMDYYIWLCPAPCLLWKDQIEAHRAHLDQARRFLKWESKELFSLLEQQMRERAKNLDFEEAQSIKETLASLNILSEKQKVRDIIDGDIDVFIKYEKYDSIYMALTQIRSSQIVGIKRYEVSLWASDQEDAVVHFLTSQYLPFINWTPHEEWAREGIPDILILAEQIQDTVLWDFFQEIRLKVELPKIWPKYDILQFTLNQVKEYAYKTNMTSLETRTFNRSHMVNVLKRLGYPVPEKWEIVFECYDISHTDGHFTYASRVTIIDGKPEPWRYKKYKIKCLTDGEIDDYASHREVMFRRTLEGLDQNNFPHLIIIDGGKWQLTSAIQGMRWARETYRSDGNEDKVYHENHVFPVCSLAKREEEVFLPSENVSILFEKWSPELMVLQKARDESHRFSITANRNARMKSMKRNILEEIPWIGPITRKKLLKVAGDVEWIRWIPFDQLKLICNQNQILSLRDHGFLDTIS